MTSPKSHWSIIKIFLNNKKIPCIPPLLQEFMYYMINSSQILKKRPKYLTVYKTMFSHSNLPSVPLKNAHKLLSTIHFTNDNILKVFKNLDSNKAHGHDMINLQIMNICDASICKPLILIFGSCLEIAKFLTESEKTDVVPAHKKRR